MSTQSTQAEKARLADLQPDEHNANRGTERGRYMLEQSLRKLGAGRSIVLDKHGRIIAGNKTAEVAAAIGLEDVVIVRTKGDQVVAVLREDLDLSDPAGIARELAYADNRVGEVSLDFDPDAFAADLAAGLDLSDYWHDGEIEDLLAPPEFPDPEPQREPELASDHLIEIRCDAQALHAMRKTLQRWAGLDGVSVSIA